ncbi:lytic transglycosylase domain-containing protein [Mucilaginibacter antarcticus]|uniref:Transglycosylase SLT domain-containing protein n=1 Tax=Mucilaginibacter antarcticus TaxID=1855725 RepID=A0ABW5XHC5_9SPHI
MKRLLTFATILLSQQIVQAHSLTTIADSTVRMMRGSYAQNNTRDTILNNAYNPYEGSLYKTRLDAIQKEIQLDYNPFVQEYIDLYMRNKSEMGHVLGLSKYYFPIYEKIFREAGIPTEIKYLSVVESKLNPNAVSRVGATGPWQFMAPTAKMFGLNMDNYVDERKDPIQSCYAAAAYLKDAYMEFGDWLLAIAAYNSGKSNIARAVEQAGSLNFWTIRQYLPPETRSYVPAYIAMSYVMNYGEKHNIVADHWAIAANTDTVMVDRMVDLSNVARALNANMADITLLNPAYKRLIVNGTKAAPRRLVIPKVGQVAYTNLYNVLNNIAAPMLPVPPPAALPVIQATEAIAGNETPLPVLKGSKTPDYYITKSGDTLEAIADMYGLDVREIKAWNRQQSTKVTAGQKLRLNPFAKAVKG